MRRSAWSAKRERQYDHIRGGWSEHGKGTKLAEEIAARNVGSERGVKGGSKMNKAALDNALKG